MKQRAYSKINLSLNINGIDEKGYHTLQSIFLPIDFYDEIEVTKNDEMIYECNKTFITFNENNTIVKAIKLMKEEFDIKDNFKIVLNKHIPMQAGLAGGSSNGACIIRIINYMYHLNLSDERIKELCLKIGADVLFTYYSKPALVTGIGENIKFINVKKKYNVLIVKPRLGVSTKECYDKMNMDSCDHPDIDKLKDALENGNSINGLLGNSLEEAAFSINEDIVKAKELLKEKGLENILMSGSGSSVFAIDEDYNKLKSVYDEIKESNYFVRITKVKNW